MKKQLLSVLLCLIMVAGMLPTAALADEAPPFDLATDLAGITIPDDLVTCICTKTGESKSYGKLPNGFSASKIEKEGDVWTVIISIKNSVYISADIMLFQDLRDLTGSDLRLGGQLLQNLRLRVRRDSRPAGHRFLRFLHRHTSNPRAGSSAR